MSPRIINRDLFSNSDLKECQLEKAFRKNIKWQIVCQIATSSYELRLWIKIPVNVKLHHHVI